MRSMALCLSLALAVACSGDKDGSDDTGTPTTTVGDDDDDTTGIDAAGLYSSQCASCHGASGEGGVAEDTMATYVTGSTEADISAQIQNGGGSMPAISALTPEEADAVAAWVLAEFGAR